MLRYYVSDSGQSGYKLRADDVIKMGRCKYWVREIVGLPEEKKLGPNAEHAPLVSIPSPMTGLASEQKMIPEEPLSPQLQPASTQLLEAEMTPLSEIREESAPVQEPSPPDAKAKSEGIQCRICLGDENKPSDPLIESPCACTGSVRLVHVECLKEWLKSKVVIKKTDCAITYTWKEFECEVCKNKYPGIRECYITSSRLLGNPRRTKVGSNKVGEAGIALHAIGG